MESKEIPTQGTQSGVSEDIEKVVDEVLRVEK